jgi:hypothetical protein
MSDARDSARRDRFLSKLLEQFEALAGAVDGPWRVEAFQLENEVVLAIAEQNGDDRLRVAARFDDAAAGRPGFRELLKLTVEEQGEKTEMLMLGWSSSVPDVDRGLDSLADHSDGVYRMGQVVQALRRDIALSLGWPRAGASLPRREERQETQAGTAGAAERNEEPVPTTWRAAAKTVVVPGPAPQAKIELLQAALGELAALGGLRAEKVFTGFIMAAESGSPLAQGAVTAFLQGALLDLYVLQHACVAGPGWMRPRSLREAGGALQDAVLRIKAVLFEGNEEVQRQVAREMVSAMRIFYEQALKHANVGEAEVAAMAKSAFGNAGTITSEAVKGLSASVSGNRRERARRSLPGKSLE